MENIEDIYELSPMQQGMLFHTLYSPDSGEYFEQFNCLIKGELDVELFQRAWQYVINRHHVLRTSFLWKELDAPLQVVHREAALPWKQYDWSDLPQSVIPKKIKNYLDEDRKQKFDLDQAPLMRCGVIKIKEDEFRFVWSNHHILIDGWSLPIILGDVISFYEKAKKGQSQESTPPRTFRDYILWHQNQDLTAAERYWREMLQGFQSPSPLPNEINLPSSSDVKNFEHQIIFSEELSDGIRTFATGNQLTINTIMQGAWGILLSRFNGESDVIFGSTISGRPPDLPGAEKIVGLFINTVPVRAIFPDKTSVLNWLKSFQEQQILIRKFGYTPLIDIQNWCDLPSQTSLFDSIFIFENYPVDSTLKQQKGSLVFSDIQVSEQTNYPLTVVANSSDRIALKFNYSPERLDDETVQRLLVFMQKILGEIISNPDQNIKTLPILPQEESKKILVDWNSTNWENPRNQPIHQLFESQSSEQPDRKAVIFEDLYLTYAELNSRANKLGRYLRSLGVRTESKVAVCLERSIEVVETILAILKAGGAYLPLDPEYPVERLEYMLSDANVDVLVTRDGLINNLAKYAGKVVLVDRDRREFDFQPGNNLESEALLDNLAYVIYTSGSTGKPKGVQLTHRGLVNLVEAQINGFQLDPESRVLQFASLSFDASVSEIFTSLVSGATLVLAKKNDLRDPEKVSNILRREEISVVTLPPSFLRAMVSESFPNLKTIMSAGERCDWDIYRKWGPDRRMINGYGPTESTIGPSWSVINEERKDCTSVPIGKPIRNVKIFVLDNNQQPVPIGVPGELFVGGVGVARGYLARPGLTAEKFIPNPYGNGERLYRSGDIVRWMADGALEFLGREDEQVKVRGFRIELGEVESAHAEYPDCQECIVQIRKEETGRDLIVAYIVPAPGITLNINELREFLGKRLPDFMIPNTFFSLDAMPLTPSGKVDRQALQDNEDRRLQLANEFIAPRTPEEIGLAEIWSSVLKVDEIGVNDNFFELGGDSLLAVQAVSRTESIFQITLPLEKLFLKPTIGLLANEVLDTIRIDQGVIIPQVSSARIKGDIPLSFAQQRMWFLEQISPDSGYYNLPGLIKLKGPLDISALQLSLNTLALRHESLRTVFPSINGVPSQVINEDVDLPFPVVDLKLLTEDDQEIALREEINKASLQPFDLTVGPLLRLKLFQLADDEFILAFIFHHIIADGWSLGIVMREIGLFYDGVVNNQKVELPPIPVQYKDFSIWQRGWMQGDQLKRQLDYWKEHLEGSPLQLDLPIDKPRPTSQSHKGSHLEFELPQKLSGDLIDLSKQYNVTLYMVLLAAFQTLLHRYSGQTQINVGTPIANRTRPEIEGIIGCFVNTLVMSTDFSEDPTFLTLLEQVKSVALGAYAHQSLPFEKLVDSLELDREFSQSPLFQVMFVWQNFSSERLSLSGLEFESLPIETQTARFDLSISMSLNEGKINGLVVYSVNLFEKETIDQIIRNYLTLLGGITSNLDTAISNLPLLSEDDRFGIINDWNNTSQPFSDNSCIHSLIEKHVAKEPEAEAVRFEEQSLSYRELNARANQLGRYLQMLEAGPEVPVGVCLERSADVAVAILAILKAGSAYLPLDPEYPPERLRYMIKDAGIDILISRDDILGQFPEYKGKVVDLNNDQDKYNHHFEGNLKSGVRPENLAYVIYTSGSTGRPKGVQLAHKGLVNLVEAQIEKFQLTPNSRILQFSALSFDASIGEIFNALTCGGTIVFGVSDDLRDPGKLVKIIKNHKINVIYLPPSFLRFLPEQSLETIETILSAGERCDWDIYEKWGKNRLFINGYGPTEVTVGPSVYVVEGKRLDCRSVSIGKPIKNVQVYILDKNMEPVPIGVTGEIHVGGVGLARGYLGQPGLTAERFVPNPYGGGERLYKTGDLARWLRDGNMEFLGREDDQVKVRGFRIELGEIESILAKYPGSAESVVVVRRGENGRNQLVAYIVPREGSEVNVTEIRAYLSEHLPGYMVPGNIVGMEEMPLTPSGKIDRKGLPEIDGSRLETAGEYIAPRTDEEKVLAEIWREVLGMEKVGVKDNFFELGGDSILSIQIVAQAQAAGMGVTPQQMFQHPTIEGLAAVADEKGVVEAEQGLVTGEVALIPIQRWFFEQEVPEPHYWNQTVMVKVKGGMEKKHLEGAVGAILRHHDALRSRYYKEDGEWKAEQKGEGEEAEIEWVDLRDEGVEEKRGVLEKSAAEYQESLDLTDGPLMRVVYYEMGEGEDDRLLVVAHHLVVDGVSWRIILEDLVTAYEQEKKGEEVVLPAKTTSYQKWAERIELYAQSEEIGEEKEYWLKERMGGKERLPVDQKGGRNMVGEAEVVRVEMKEEKTRALLQDVSPVYNTKIQEVMLTAMVMGFSRWTGNSQLLVDMEGHGRVELFEDVDLSRTVGWFTSMYPIVLRIEAGRGPGEALKEVKEQMRAIPKEGIGYGLLRYKREDGELREELAAKVEAEVSFNYLGQMDQVLGRSEKFGVAEENTGMPFSPKGKRKHLIEMNSLVVEKKLRMNWTYSPGVHRQETIEKLAQGYEEALDEIIVHCQSPDAGGYTPSDFPDVDLDQDDLDALLEEIDDTLFE